MSSNLPVEWKNLLALRVSEPDIKRLESLMARGTTAPMSPEKETGPFLLFMIGDSLEDISTKTGTPKDVIYLTYLKYGWEEKKAQLTAGGMDKVVDTIHKNMINHVLLATHKVLIDQVSKVLSGDLPPEKCTYIPRSLHGLQQLIEVTSKVNDLVKDGEKKQGNNIIQANNVQINQSVEPAKEETKRVSREDRLAKLAEQQDKK